MNTRVLNQKLQHQIKTIADRGSAAIALILLSPLLLGVAIAIYIQMGYPIIFTQPRPGKNGQIFTFYKFRTMLADARDVATDDPSYQGDMIPDFQRITPLGHWLRNTSLDELPQLWNVLKGDMSLVGPRPLRVAYLSRYSPEQARRHEVKPGITGLAQVNGRNTIRWEEKFKLDVWYVDHYSLWLDLTILVATIGKVLHRDGINNPHAVTQKTYTEEEFRGQLDAPYEQPVS
jgi:sugar transferase EpsL